MSLARQHVRDQSKVPDMISEQVILEESEWLRITKIRLLPIFRVAHLGAPNLPNIIAML